MFPLKYFAWNLMNITHKNYNQLCTKYFYNDFMMVLIDKELIEKQGIYGNLKAKNTLPYLIGTLIFPTLKFSIKKLNDWFKV